MNSVLKIAIIGNYNYRQPSHGAINDAIDHAREFLDLKVNYYWLKASEVIAKDVSDFAWHGFWLTPSINDVVHQTIVQQIATKKIPTLLTGHGFELFIRSLIDPEFDGHLNGIPNNREFEYREVEVIAHSKTFRSLYNHSSTQAFSDTLFRCHDAISSQLDSAQIDVESFNSYGEPEIVSLKNHPFFVACNHYPQLSSAPNWPHPLIYTFIKACNLGRASQF